MKNVIFLGGDRRMVYAAEVFKREYNCVICGFGGNDSSALNAELEYDYAVLPIQPTRDGKTIPTPLSADAPTIGFDVLKGIMKRNAVIFTGNTCSALERLCREEGYTLINYFEREEIAVANAVPTAEGALEIAISRLPVTIFGSTALITGFGRIAKILGRYLHGLGARVYIACRKKSDLKWAEIYGFKAIDITDRECFNSAAAKADVIFNTVPFGVFTRETVSGFKEEALYIELASTDGIERGGAEKLKFERVIARGLPGKTAPVTAGQIIAETIKNILIERRGENDA